VRRLRRFGVAGVVGLAVVVATSTAAQAADATGAKALADLAVFFVALVVGVPALALALVTGIISIRLGKQATTTKQVFKRSVLGGVAVFLFAVAALAGGALGGLVVGRQYEFWVMFAAAAAAALVWIGECAFSAWQYRRVYRQTKSQSAEVFSVIGLAASALLTVATGIVFSTCAYTSSHRSVWTFTWSYDGDTEHSSAYGTPGCNEGGKTYKRSVAQSRRTACNTLCARRPGPEQSACREGCPGKSELTDQQCHTELTRTRW